MKPAEVDSKTIRYAGHDGAQIDAYMSRPTTPGPHPGVVVIMEAFGLVEHMKDVARRLAGEGYVAIAPDLYTREGSPDPGNMDKVIAMMFSIPDSQALGDLDAAAAYLKAQGDSNGRVGAIGFCSGGRYTLALACNTDNLDAAIDSAGGYIIQDELTRERPVSPIDMVSSLSCPLLALFGEEDPNPSPAHARQLEKRLDEHGKTYEMRMYPEAGHAFFADYRPTYRPVAAQDMWHRVLLFYEKHLKS